MSIIKPRQTAAATARTPAKAGTRAGAASGFKFSYTRSTPEEVRDRATRSMSGRDSYFLAEVKFFTPREGLNTVRILPAPPGVDWGHYGVGVTVHYDIGPDGSAYLCAAKMKGEPCAACEERTTAASHNEEELVKALKPGNRVAIYVIDRSKESDGPLLWNVAEGMDKDITKLRVDPGSGEVLYPDDPDAGYDISFTREGQGLKTKYKGLQIARRESPLSDDPVQYASWLKYICDKPIDQMLLFHPYERIAASLAGTAAAPAAAAAGAQQQEEAPAPTGRVAIRPRGAPAAAAKEPDPEPTGDGADVPSWDELAEAPDEALEAMVEQFNFTPPAEGFNSADDLRTWLADQLGIEPPPPAPEPAAAPAGRAATPAATSGGSWRDKLAAAATKK